MLPAWIHGESCEVLSRSTLARSASNKCSFPLKKASSLVMAPGVPGFHCERTGVTRVRPCVGSFTRVRASAFAANESSWFGSLP